MALAFIGYLFSFFVIRRLVNGWPKPTAFTDDVIEGTRQLFVAVVFMIPALIVAMVALYQSAKNKQVGWSIVYLVALLLTVMLVYYFAIPVVSPAVGD